MSGQRRMMNQRSTLARHGKLYCVCVCVCVRVRASVKFFLISKSCAFFCLLFSFKQLSGRGLSSSFQYIGSEVESELVKPYEVEFLIHHLCNLSMLLNRTVCVDVSNGFVFYCSYDCN